jgi:hypothetical protein
MKNIKEKIEQGWIRCNIIIEVLGKPADYLDKVIKKTIEELEKSEITIVLDKKFHEPTPVENMFSTFVEIEILIKNMRTLIEFLFIYMPSHIEILEPTNIKLGLNDANEFINHLAARIHQYDAIAKRVIFENKVLRHKLEELGELPKEIEEMDKVMKEKGKEESSGNKEKKN